MKQALAQQFEACAPVHLALPCTLDGAQEAHLIALACSTPPNGRGRWTLRLRANRFVTLDWGERISHVLVRRTLKKTHSRRG